MSYCCICTQPICKKCIGKEHFSITAGFRDLYYCNECINKEEKIEKRFFENIRLNKTCAKHSSQEAEAYFTKCGLNLCRYCTYYLERGFVSKERLGPYCLACVRTDRVINKKKYKFVYS